jgi:hypothetical protein
MILLGIIIRSANVVILSSGVASSVMLLKVPGALNSFRLERSYGRITRKPK